MPLLCDWASTPELALSGGNDSSGGRRASIQQTQTGSGFQQVPLFVLEGILVSAHGLTGNKLAISGRELSFPFYGHRDHYPNKNWNRQAGRDFSSYHIIFLKLYFVSGKSLKHLVTQPWGFGIARW